MKATTTTVAALNYNKQQTTIVRKGIMKQIKGYKFPDPDLKEILKKTRKKQRKKIHDKLIWKARITATVPYIPT